MANHNVRILFEFGSGKKWRAIDLLQRRRNGESWTYWSSKEMESHGPTGAKKKWRAIDLLEQKRNEEP